MDNTLWFMTSSLVFYALSAISYLALPSKYASTEIFKKRIGFPSFMLATALNSVALYYLINHGYRAGLSLHILIVVVGWLATIGKLKIRIDTIGTFTAPVLIILMLLELFTQKLTQSKIGDPSLLSTVHISSAIIGQAFAIIASAIAVRYLWARRVLKQKIMSQLKNDAPALNKLEHHMNLTLFIGFIFITLGLITGAMVTQVHLQGTFNIDIIPKIIWAVCVWTWYLTIFLARNTFNLSTKRIAQLSLAGFLLLGFFFFGLSFVIDADLLGVL